MSFTKLNFVFSSLSRRPIQGGMINPKRARKERKGLCLVEKYCIIWVVDVTINLHSPKIQASVRRDARSVPNLIYAIEQLEKFLIKLDKKAKVIMILGYP